MPDVAGSVHLSESFNYANQAGLVAAWNAGLGDNSSYALDAGIGNPGNSYRMASPTTNFSTAAGEFRLGRNIGVVNGVDANPLILSFDLLLESESATSFWNGARHFVELRGYENGQLNDGGLTNLIATGVFNASDDAFSTQYYQGRVVLGSNWVTLNEEAGAPKRSTGWRNLSVEIRSLEIRFYVDGVLVEIEPRPNALPFDSVVLGSGLTSSGVDAWVDNIIVRNAFDPVVPEPTSMLVWGLGAVACSFGRCIRLRRPL